jgi:hypothetical protein
LNKNFPISSVYVTGKSPYILPASGCPGQKNLYFQQGYRFFMIALKDVEAAERIVREIRGLLPAGAPA